MAGTDSQKPLLTLIREFTTEKSQGERRIASQKKRIEELRLELESSNADLEQAKRDKEATEQQLKGFEVELSMNEASSQALEVRIALINNEISRLGSELAALKTEENSSRDGFIEKMLELNAEIRKFQALLAKTSDAENYCKASLDGGSSAAHEQEVLQATVVSEDKLAQIISQTEQMEEEYKAAQIIHDQVQQELIGLEKKALLLESVMKENMQLQELSQQTSVLEAKCAALGDELQKRFLCPRCCQDNSGELDQILQMSGGS